MNPKKKLRGENEYVNKFPNPEEHFQYLDDEVEYLNTRVTELENANGNLTTELTKLKERETTKLQTTPKTEKSKENQPKPEKPMKPLTTPKIVKPQFETIDIGKVRARLRGKTSGITEMLTNEKVLLFPDANSSIIIPDEYAVIRLNTRSRTVMRMSDAMIKDDAFYDFLTPAGDLTTQNPQMDIKIPALTEPRHTCLIRTKDKHKYYFNATIFSMFMSDQMRVGPHSDLHYFGIIFQLVKRGYDFEKNGELSHQNANANPSMLDIYNAWQLQSLRGI